MAKQIISKSNRTAKQKAGQKYNKSIKGKATRKRHSQTEKGKFARNAATKRFRARNPNYIKASHAVNDAVRVGKLPRPDTKLCHYCPKPAQQYHHYLGYAPEHWLDVLPACRRCHRKAH